MHTKLVCVMAAPVDVTVTVADACVRRHEQALLSMEGPLLRAVASQLAVPQWSLSGAS